MRNATKKEIKIWATHPIIEDRWNDGPQKLERVQGSDLTFVLTRIIGRDAWQLVGVIDPEDEPFEDLVKNSKK